MLINDVLDVILARLTSSIFRISPYNYRCKYVRQRERKGLRKLVTSRTLISGKNY